MTENKPSGATAERLAGKSLADDAFQPFLQRGTAHLIQHLADKGYINSIIAFLRTKPGMIVREGLPSALNVALGKFALSTEHGHFIRDILVHAVNEFSEIAGKKGGFEEKDIETVLGNARKAVEKKLYKVESNRNLFHSPKCHIVAQFDGRSSFHRKGQPHTSHSAVAEITFLDALAQGLEGCQHCIGLKQVEIDDPVQKVDEHAEPSPKSGRKLSPMDVVGSADPELQTKFYAWLRILTSDHRERAVKLLKHLDSMTELDGLMAAPPDMRETVLELLENSNASFKASEFIAGVGERIGTCAGKTANSAKKAGQKIGQAYTEFDQSLAPTVVKLEKWRNKPRRRPTFFECLFTLY